LSVCFSFALTINQIWSGQYTGQGDSNNIITVSASGEASPDVPAGESRIEKQAEITYEIN